MKTLLILRHAKSSWKNTGLADHERAPHQVRQTRRGYGCMPYVGDQPLVCCASPLSNKSVAGYLATLIELQLSTLSFGASPQSTPAEHCSLTPVS